MSLHTYKQLIVWQKSIELVTIIFTLTEKFPKTEIFGLVSQMRRAAISIPSNIAEGAGRGSRKEYRQFITIALGSAYELETQLVIADKLNFIDKSEITKCGLLLTEIQKMLYSLKTKL